MDKKIRIPVTHGAFEFRRMMALVLISPSININPARFEMYGDYDYDEYEEDIQELEAYYFERGFTKGYETAQKKYAKARLLRN